MVEVVGILLIVATALFIGYPLLQKSPRQLSFGVNHQAEDLQARKEEIYAAIRDIDFDFRMGKLSAEDHALLREQYRNEAINIMKQLDTLLPAAGRGGRRSKPAGSASATRFCSQCGEPAQAADKFCSACGASLA
ncbi:MAG: zinc ribbon domain-containing protein [candidate division KSB1 bacterium]|nr:zinc ribbon domain-containing protein [candidate division KSB1 bacterium]MDZ7273154.1 zinc ribbon domain-containing protein [candidate division KSB1 bacterium]MDZ7285256.1 zinc ribbon domain-containing protein [candidate division KSB1 bacterium]MDZ7298288.1 zinc ribbon domain-containing protein [candidate division KSB1 bacterium]MDZ7306631.1 zinc ribbon domain-containing protein [candidate division KSB1 bacterium]